MRKWQILEFDGKPYYAFVPENMSPLEDSYLSDEASDEMSNEKSGLICYSSNDENTYEEFEELVEDEEEAAPSLKNRNIEAIEEQQGREQAYGDIFQVKIEDLNVLGSNSEEPDADEPDDVEDVDYAIEDYEEDEWLEEKSEKKEDMRAFIGSSENSSLKCKLCSETFESNLVFRKHVAWIHRKRVYIKDSGSYVCCICDYKSAKKNLFANHLQRKHESLSTKKMSTNVFPCAACGFECRSKHSLQSHFIRKHTDRYEHQCKFCTKKFKVKGDLTNHVRFHHKEKPINCDVCGKLCLNSGSLYVHQKWAHYKPKFECPICKRRMVTQQNLDQHMVSQHEKREKIVCAECGKTFSKKDSFKRHMAVHTGNKPYPCVICQKHFARRSQLRQHLLIHTGKKPFVCDICGKAFTQKPGLICHRKIHPGPHPPLPVMPIGDIVKELTEAYYAEAEVENQQIE